MPIQETTAPDTPIQEEEISTKQYKYTFTKVIFFILIVALALATYLSGHSATIVQNNDPNTFLYKAAMILTPLFVHLTVINIVIIILLIVKRSLWLIIPCLVIALNWHITPSIIQIRGTSNTIDSASELTLQSYNVHRFRYGSFDNTVDNILFSVYRNKVDILCLQEYSSYIDEANYKEQTSTITDYVRNSNRILSQNDTINKNDKKSTFSKVFPYVCFSNPDNRTGLALFSVHPIVHSEIYNFPESAQAALLADIDVSGKLLRIITVHLQSTTISQHNREISTLTDGFPVANASSKLNALSTLAQAILENSSKRKSQVDMICELIEKSPHPVIVCGDFNDTPNSYSYHKFEQLLNDAFKTTGSGYAFSYIPLLQSLRLDYIFYSNNIEPIQFYYRSYSWSDHRSAFFRFSAPTTMSVE